MRKLIVNDKYPYAYETHLHTNQGSACGKNTGAEMALACKEAGYTGIIVTDHFFYGNTCVDRNLPWSDWVEGYTKGYESAREMGDKIGLQVFFGWEASYEGNDFLVYGLDKQWLLSHPEIRDASVKEQYELVHADGGVIIHAHPFREEFYIPKVRLFPEWVDGVEVLNASHMVKFPEECGSSVFDRRALEYANEYHFPQIGGSDIHDVNLIGGGTAFTRKLTDIHDFARAVLKEERLVLPGLSGMTE